MKKGEIYFFGICLAFFGFMLYRALDLVGVGRSGEIGSGFWPLIALGVTTLLSLFLFISSIRKYRQEADEASAEQTEEAIAENKPQQITVALSAICFLVYLLVMPWIGFILSTFLFIPAFAMALGERRRMVLIISPLLLATILVAIFAKFINVPFPKGVGIFAAFSRLFH